MMDNQTKSPSQVAAELSQAAQVAAAQAADAAELATLQTISQLKDFAATTNGNAFAAARLKSAYIRRFGFERFQNLCGASR